MTLSSDLPHYVGRVKPGVKADVVVMRDGRKKTVRVKVGVLPNQNQLANAGQSKPDLATGNRT